MQTEGISYTVLMDSQLYGPFSLAEIRQLSLLPDIQVNCSARRDEWLPASQYPELMNFLFQTSPSQEAFPAVDLSSSTFYYKEDTAIYGPFSIEELAVMVTDDNSMVSIGDLEHFVPANTIPGLMYKIGTLAGRSSTNEYCISNPELDRNEFAPIIAEQEAEIMALESQLSNFLNHKDKVPTIDFDFSSPADSLFQSEFLEINRLSEQINALLPVDDKTFVRVFTTPSMEQDYYLNLYETCHSKLQIALQNISEKATQLQEQLDTVSNQLDSYCNSRRQQLETDNIDKERKIVNDFKEQIDQLSASSSANIELAISSLKASLEDAKRENAVLHAQNLSALTQQANAYRLQIKRAFREKSNQIITTLKQSIEHYVTWFDAYFQSRCETAGTTEDIWNKTNSIIPSSSFLIGKSIAQYEILDHSFLLEHKQFIHLYNDKNLLLKYNKATQVKCTDIVNAIIARSLASSSAGNLNLTMIDSEEMCGTSNILKTLNRDIFSIAVRPDDIHRRLDHIERRIEDIIQNLLHNSIGSLREYNDTKENKEQYQLVIIKGFPSGIYGDSIYLLNKILKNGIKAGVNVIMMVDTDMLRTSEDALKGYRSIEWSNLESQICEYDFSQPEFLSIDQKMWSFESIPNELFKRIVNQVNMGLEVKEDEIVTFSDYIPDKSEWWTRRSASFVDIPFGVATNKSIQALHISQESGQNTVMVIGIPGSGKSVFLHSVIINAAINYSPEELNLYLLDFSGVEFNTYALHSLPHARVIAPEAEREFGLSILNELVEEGTRRMVICRENDVKNIVDLKNKRPDLVIPRLLVIIDEFQKLFEIESDSISREANSKICTIIQEFRKFGINLILATQKLPSSSILPKDLIANRVLFRSQPNDFATLISLKPGERMPQLDTGECIYNSQSGAETANQFTRAFYLSNKNIDETLTAISKFSTRHECSKPKDAIVFSSSALPSFENRKTMLQHSQIEEFPYEVGIYFGESIAIEQTDVCAVLQAESNNNILIIGGETEIAERMAIYASLSAMSSHTDHSATFYFLNFIKPSDKLYDIPVTLFPNEVPFDIFWANKSTDVQQCLSQIKEIIDERKGNDECEYHNVYLSIYAFQLARMFDRGGRRGDDESESALLLDYILKNGPIVGIFTILQVDNLTNLARISANLQVFEHKIVLQMEENDSIKIMGTPAASKLYVMNRPSSKYRSYYVDRSMNVIKKFKPYKQFDYEN